MALRVTVRGLKGVESSFDFRTGSSHWTRHSAADRLHHKRNI